MNQLRTIEIETDRLILRRFVDSDIQASFDNWAGDEKVTKYLRWETHASVDITRSILCTWINSYINNDFYQWAIILKEYSDKPIVTISVVEKDDNIDMVHIGYCIGSKWWNKGITSEAFMAIIPFFFDRVKVNRIESQHDSKNINSGKVMMKCGLKYEGTLRQWDKNNRGICDATMYSLLSEEYYFVEE